MRTFIRGGLALAGLGSALPAVAGSWSVQGGIQHSDLSTASDVVDARDGHFLGASYWFTPDVAADLVVSSSGGNTFDTRTISTTRSLRSVSLGARKQWSLSPQWSLDATAGAELLSVDRQLVRTDPIYIDPDGNALITMTRFYDHRRRDLAPYLGLGIGWHPDPAWTLRLDARRSQSEVGVRCRYGLGSRQCSDHESGHLDTLRVGFEYHFH